MKIADFFGSVGFKVDIKPLDDALNRVENKLDRFINRWNGKTIHLGARVNSTALNKSITDAFKSIQGKRTLKFNATIDKIKIDKSIVGNAIKAANLKLSNIKVSGKTAAINLDNFKVNQASLKSSLMAAISAVEKQLQINLNVNARTGRVGGGNVSNTGTPVNRSRGRFGGLHTYMGLEGGVGAAFIGGGPLAGAAATAVYGFHRWNETNNQMNAIRNTIRAVTDSPEEAGSTEKFLKQTSMENGLDYIALAHPAAMTMASARRTKMKGQPTLDLIKAVSEYGSVMGLDGQGIEGTFRALYQMMSKGQVMSEELKRQLDEHLPGSEQMMAQAYSKLKGGHGVGDEKDVMTLLKAMKAGQVIPSEILPIWTQLVEAEARRGGALDAARTSPRAAQQRFHDQLYFFSQEFGAAGGNKGASKVYESLSRIVNALRGNVDKLASSFSWLMDRIGNLVDDSITLFTWFNKLWNSLDKGQKSIITFGSVLTVLARNPIFAAFTGLYLVLEDIATYFAGGDSVTGRLLKMMPDMKNVFGDFGTSVGTLFTNVLQIVNKVFEGWKLILGSDFVKSLLSEGLTQFIKDLTSIVDLLNQVLDIIVKLTNGDFKGAEKAGEKVLNALPTSPLTAPLKAGVAIRDYNNSITPEQAGRAYVETRRGMGFRDINGPTPNIVINSPLTINGANSDVFQQIQDHVNNVFKEAAMSFPEKGV